MREISEFIELLQQALDYRFKSMIIVKGANRMYILELMRTLEYLRMEFHSTNPDNYTLWRFNNEEKISIISEYLKGSQ